MAPFFPLQGLSWEAQHIGRVGSWGGARVLSHEQTKESGPGQGTLSQNTGGEPRAECWDLGEMAKCRQGHGRGLQLGLQPAQPQPGGITRGGLGELCAGGLSLSPGLGHRGRVHALAVDTPRSGCTKGICLSDCRQGLLWAPQASVSASVSHQQGSPHWLLLC